MANRLGIFSGKQKEYNTRALTLLYDNGPLTAWDLTSKLTDVGKISLHATLNKRLRDLEKKAYLYRVNKKWYLSFKGIIAVLIVQEKPKMWNLKWKEIFDLKARKIEEDSTPYLIKYGIKKENIGGALRRMGLSLDDFKAWIGFSGKVKDMMENGIVNFDLINERTLLSLILFQIKSAEELATVWNPEDNTVI
jgi:hypothetical protein